MSALADVVLESFDRADTRDWASWPMRGALRPLTTDWPSAVLRHLEEAPCVVRVLVADVRGSAPREPGACMLVTHESVAGTVGGGNLEWHGVEVARELLSARLDAPSVRLERLTLARELAQCCGGVVQLWFERFSREDVPLLRAAAAVARSDAPAHRLETRWTGNDLLRRLVPRTSTHPADSGLRVACTVGKGVGHSGSVSHITLLERLELDRVPLWLYGAGHVGQALVRVLAELPFDITWVDARAGLFPAELPANVRELNAPIPAEVVARAPRAARHLVMTHDHGLDYALCRAILLRGQFTWLGLIGSQSKGARFRSRLKRDGVPEDALARLVCPIGVGGISSKLPAAIAVGVAAQLLQGFDLSNVPVRTGNPLLAGCSAESCATCRPAVRAGS